MVKILQCENMYYRIELTVESRLTENGSNFSSDEQQRLIITRGL